MKIYSLKRQQFLKIKLDEAWLFFSSPNNLATITPKELGFEILSETNDGMFAGQIINYKVRPAFGIAVRWTTEITHCEKSKYFVDEQRFGPYSFWHHKHFFEVRDGGVLATDIVDYALPFGILGRLVHALFVKKKLEAIFDYRFRILEEKFNQHR